MSQVLPALPDGFRWQRIDEDLCMVCGQRKVLSIHPQRGGWVIEFHVTHDGRPAGVATVSEQRAIGRAVRWIRARASLVAERATAMNAETADA